MLMLINPSSLGAVIFPLTRCLNAGAEDFIVNPLQSKEVQHLWNCSTAMRPSKGAALFEAIVAKRSPWCCRPPTLPSGRRLNLAGVAMERTSRRLPLLALGRKG
jgi:two-component response regulator (ARR-A family)